MKITDFKVGQTVYLKSISHLFDCWKKERIETGVVTKIGRKYITVKRGVREYQFIIDEDFRERTDCSIEYELFLTERDIRDYWQTRLRSKVVMLLRSITIKPINYMKEPLAVGWHPEYGDTEFPFCPVCDEYAYKKTHCIFCGRRFIWKDGN